MTHRTDDNLLATAIAVIVAAETDTKFKVSEPGYVELFRGNELLVIGNEYDDAGEYDGYTYTVYYRDSELSNLYSEHVTTDGATDNVGLRDMLTDWCADRW